MWEDPIVAEVRRIRERLAAQYAYDLRALYTALKDSERRSEGQKVEFPPKPAAPPLEATKPVTR